MTLGLAACGDDETGPGDDVAPTCVDFVQNGDETDVDCGGPDCGPCDEGLACASNDDCTSMACADGTCVRSRCNDDELNGLETDVDCGGPDCLPCPADGTCLTGRDCLTLSCERPAGGELGTCVDPCTDGRISAGERGVDCGGVCPARCPAGTGCEESRECESGVCEGFLCQAPACDDRIRNGDESDRDCGGLSCPGCAPGRACQTGADCASQICLDDDTCAAPTCDDGFQNGTETDVDCGGPECGPCPDRGSCEADSDCRSRVCGEDGTCQPATCEDGVANGRETDVDCGGRTCAACGDLRRCDSGTDCRAGVCFEGFCGEPVLTEFGRDSFGYIGYEYSWPGSPCPDISDTGIALPVTNEGTAPIALPFDFEFYGETYDEVIVTPNGMVLFDPTDDTLNRTTFRGYCMNISNTIFPAGPFISGWYLDWNPDEADAAGGGGVWYEVIGDAPNRTVVIQWQTEWDSTFYTDQVDFRVSLQEGTNIVSTCFADVGLGISSYDGVGYGHTGIRNTGSQFIQYTCNTFSSVVREGTTLRYEPPAD